ncbi:c-type cytochrome, partial [Bacillus sp. SG-1]|uniref:c-type cytochrome n=1 Tax=Bacillus sp. SG-1 TaxID=161544 RepID=UPI000154453E
CIACHSTDVVIGGSFKLQSSKLQKDYDNKDKLHNFVQKNMPEDEPGSLSAEEYEAVVDYIWNGQK